MALYRRTDRPVPPQPGADPPAEVVLPEPATLPPPATPETISRHEPPPSNEIVIETKTGRIRQAGADSEGAWLNEQRVRFERSLFAFTKGVLKRKLLSNGLHRWFCDSLTKRIPPYRKMRLIPRGHLKSSIVSEAMPIHMHIQPTDGNIYWPGEPGNELNIILCGEKKDLMGSHLRWIEQQWESNPLLRLWPHRCWDNPRRQSRKWNEDEMILPRKTDYADPSLRVIGVDGAITGAHCKVLIKDDLISLAAANSQTVMQAAIDWHIASRALLAPYEETGLEYIIGTKWAVSDLYSYIQERDPSVECITRSIVENGTAIWPEQFTPDVIEQLRRDHGTRFYLFYMNNANNPELVDFSVDDLRWFELSGGTEVVFEEDSRDVSLAKRMQRRVRDDSTSERFRGQPFNAKNIREIFSGREEYFRLKAR